MLCGERLRTYEILEFFVCRGCNKPFMLQRKMGRRKSPTSERVRQGTPFSMKALIVNIIKEKQKHSEAV